MIEINVYCPICKQTRIMPKDHWQKKRDGEGPPYVKRCLVCFNRSRPPRSSEHNRRISEALKGIAKPAAVKEKIRNSLRKRKRSLNDG